MLKNYLRIALRNLVRNKYSSAINIGGLAIGMSVAILIGLWMYDETSFDHVHPNHNRIAAVLQNQRLGGGIETWWGEAMQLAPVLRKDYGADFKYVVTATDHSKHLLTYGDKKFKYNGNYMEPQAIDMLGLKMQAGSGASLQEASSVILSASAARSIFGAEDPMGKMLRFDNNYPAKVTGVYADIPANSSFADLDFISPFQLMISTQKLDKLEWGNSWFQVYVQLNDQADMATASKAIKNIKNEYSPGDRRFTPELFLFPMDRWRLYSDFDNGINTGGRIRYLQLYALIGIFVLILACINFMNLSTARSEKRAKEVGIRKAVGSMRSQLIRQFFSESLVVSFVAFLLSIGVVQLLLPFFNSLADKKMHIPYGEPLFWAAALSFTFFTGLLAGSYPALYLSSFRPVKVLKGTFRAGKAAATPRKVLVVLQFTVSVILIIGTIAVLRQVHYVKDRPVGYDRAGLIVVPKQSFNARERLDVLREALQQTGMVVDAAGSESSIVDTWITNMGIQWQGKDPALQEEFTTNGITQEFGKVTGWQIAEGRDFSRAFADSSHILVNETAVKYMGLQHPVGEVIKWGDNGRYTIIGVVKDMISQSPYNPVKPMLFYLSSAFAFSRIGYIDIRIKPQVPMQQALAAIESVFKKYDPEDPFEYNFADQEYAKKFNDEERIGRLAGFFTALAIFISCLGLLGLSSFLAEQRTREIGIRKVMGASVLHLWHLLSGEFVWLVGIALLIGVPVAWWVMHSWMQRYPYHAAISWWIFALAAGSALALTLLTVSFQAIKAALANPVKSLRSE